MNTLPASEIKRRGVVAFEEQLKFGPVHVIKSNVPSYVVITEEDYRGLVALKEKRGKPRSLLFKILSKPATGKLTKSAINKEIKQIRDEWESK